MVTLYLKIEERNGIQAANFRAYSEPYVCGAWEAYTALEMADAIRLLCHGEQSDCYPDSFRKESEKLLAEVEELCSAPKDATRCKLHIAKLLLNECGVNTQSPVTTQTEKSKP